jgi:hypothetical protein
VLANALSPLPGPLAAFAAPAVTLTVGGLAAPAVLGRARAALHLGEGRAGQAPHAHRAPLIDEQQATFGVEGQRLALARGVDGQALGAAGPVRVGGRRIGAPGPAAAVGAQGEQLAAGRPIGGGDEAAAVEGGPGQGGDQAELGDRIGTGGLSGQGVDPRITIPVFGEDMHLTGAGVDGQSFGVLRARGVAQAPLGGDHRWAAGGWLGEHVDHDVFAHLAVVADVADVDAAVGGDGGGAGAGGHVLPVAHGRAPRRPAPRQRPRSRQRRRAWRCRPRHCGSATDPARGRGRRARWPR